MKFLDYPKVVHTVIASDLRRRHEREQGSEPAQYSVLHWLTALQLVNPEIIGVLDPRISDLDMIMVLDLIQFGAEVEQQDLGAA